MNIFDELLTIYSVYNLRQMGVTESPSRLDLVLASKITVGRVLVLGIGMSYNYINYQVNGLYELYPS